MNKLLFIALGLIISGTAMATTDHYFRRDGNHVQHLKITLAASVTSTVKARNWSESSKLLEGLRVTDSTGTLNTLL